MTYEAKTIYSTIPTVFQVSVCCNIAVTYCLVNLNLAICVLEGQRGPVFTRNSSTAIHNAVPTLPQKRSYYVVTVVNTVNSLYCMI